MKKFLLSILGATALFCSEAQLYLNELYVRPNLNKGNHEYFELVNLGVAPENADCYTLVTYFNEGGSVRGFYVVDFPAVSVPAKGFLVASSEAPTFQYQLGTGTAQFSWNGGNTNRYVVQGGSLVLNNTGADYENIFFNKPQNSNGESDFYTAFLFKNGSLVDAFLGGQKGIEVPSEITELGTLVAGTGCSSIAYDFSQINSEDDSKFGSVTASAGTDNGYYRCGSGPCPEELGGWEKASSIHEHTPGAPNSNKNCKTSGGDDSDGDDDGEEDVEQTPYEIDFGCTANVFSFSIGGGPFPATVRLYADDGDGVLESTDPLRGTVVMSEPGTGAIMKQPTDEILILTIDAPGACDDLIEIIAECPADIILPVAYKAFTASRKDINVGLTWTTATEINNRGFHVERLIGRGEWEVVGFVASKAFEGNSTTDLSYSFSDVNPTRSTSIYRLRQVDIDGRSKYSETRQVRGNGENARTLVYPNPTSTGSVTIVFEEANISRNVVVSDMNGRMIQQWRNISNNSVKVENLLPGMYLVRITDLQTGAQVSEKILVNKR